MHYTNETYKRIQGLYKEIQGLKNQYKEECELFAQSLVQQGWTEVHTNEDHWLVFSPNVPTELVELANDRYFFPENKGISRDDYYDMAL